MLISVLLNVAVYNKDINNFSNLYANNKMSHVLFSIIFIIHVNVSYIDHTIVLGALGFISSFCNEANVLVRSWVQCSTIVLDGICLNRS